MNRGLPVSLVLAFAAALELLLQSLRALFESGVISYEDAMSASDSPDELALEPGPHTLVARVEDHAGNDARKPTSGERASARSRVGEDEEPGAVSEATLLFPDGEQEAAEEGTTRGRILDRNGRPGRARLP